MRRTWGVLLQLGLLWACDRGRPHGGPAYQVAAPEQGVHSLVLAIHPLHNPAKLNEAYAPLVAHLNREFPEFRIELEASRDYATFEAKVREGRPNLLLPNPWQALQAMKHGYTVIATAGDPSDFRGIFVVRKDSPLRSPADLRGQTVSYPAPTALAACLMPQEFLHRHGLDIRRDLRNHYVGSQESSIMNAYLKLSAAGATWPPPWRAFQAEHPKEAAELEVRWETPPLINNAVMVRKDFPPALAEGLARCLAGLHEHPEGRRILAGIQTSRFYRASDRDYDRVRTFVQRFEAKIRKVEEP